MVINLKAQERSRWLPEHPEITPQSTGKHRLGYTEQKGRLLHWESGRNKQGDSQGCVHVGYSTGHSVIHRPGFELSMLVFRLPGGDLGCLS